MNSNISGVLFALLGFAFFSSHDAVIKLIGGSYSPFQIVFFSTLLGFPLAVLLLMQDSTEGTLIPLHPWWSLLRTLCTVITGASVFYAFSTMPMSQVYAILFATPLLITVLSIPVLGEKVGIHRCGAVIIGLIGVLIVVRPGSAPMQLGHLTAMIGAVASSMASVIVRRIGHEERSMVLMLYPMMGNFFVMACAMPFVYKPVPIEHFGGFAVISVLGFLGGLSIIRAYSRANAAVVAPIQYSQIIWAMIFGVLIFDELPDTYTLIGVGIIIFSGLYILVREARAKTSENTPVLRNRTRFETGTSLRVGPMVRLLSLRANKR